MTEVKKEGTDILSSLLGRRIDQIFHVEVSLPEGTIVKSDTIVLLTDKGHLQLTTGLGRGDQAALLLATESELVLLGDYDDATSIRLREQPFAGLPLTASCLYAVYESLGGLDEQYLVGVFIEGEPHTTTLAFRIHLDDLVHSDAAGLWSYVGAIMTQTSRIVIERYPATREQVR